MGTLGEALQSLNQGEWSLDDLRRMWDQNQRWFATYNARLDGLGTNPAVFSHPVTGPMTVKATIELARVHFDSHLRDVRRHVPLELWTRTGRQPLQQ